MKSIKSNPIKTVLTISIGFLLVNILTEIKIFIYLSLLVGIAGLITNKLSLLIENLWFKLAYLLSFIIPNIVLTLIFYLLLFPLSILAKIKKNDFFVVKDKKSNFSKVKKQFDQKNFINPW